mmetsp:Transcript_66860/g.164858  ORF Transcript_66860/g.164858 Transcript_66860/m.164858 type:complete len:226 (-) Transcript_66860:2326-3003(-)
MTMLIRKSHRPAAALDFFFMISMLLTCSSARYGRAPSTFLAGMLLESMIPFIPLRSSMNLLTSFIMFLAAFQSRFLGPSPRIASTAAVTSSTPAGGLASDLSSPRSFLLSVSSAASAFSTAGMAAARSRSQSACILDAASATMAVLAASSLAADAATSTLAFSPPTTSATSSALRAAASTSTDLTCTCSMRIATSLDVVSSFSSPLPRRVMLPSRSVRFLLSMFL